MHLNTSPSPPILKAKYNRGKGRKTKFEIVIDFPPLFPFGGATARLETMHDKNV